MQARVLRQPFLSAGNKDAPPRLLPTHPAPGDENAHVAVERGLDHAERTGQGAHGAGKANFSGVFWDAMKGRGT